MKEYSLSFGEHTLKLGKNTCIMGVLNVTPDSFSDGGKFYTFSHAVARAKQMVEEGADIIDIGGESSRPFAEQVPLEEEIKRVVPVIEELSKHISVPISVDTVKSEVAGKAIEAGASIINDISAFESDPDMIRVTADYGVPVIVMHMKGNPRTMQIDPHYDDPVREICDYLAGVIEKAESFSIPRSKIIVDPGIGFGKTVEHNYTLLKNLEAFQSLDVPVLVGTSRKSFIRKTLSDETENDISSEIEIGTQATVAASVMNGAHIVRVHDVASTVATVKIIDALKNA